MSNRKAIENTLFKFLKKIPFLRANQSMVFLILLALMSNYTTPGQIIEECDGNESDSSNNEQDLYKEPYRDAVHFVPPPDSKMGVKKFALVAASHMDLAWVASDYGAHQYGPQYCKIIQTVDEEEMVDNVVIPKLTGWTEKDVPLYKWDPVQIRKAKRVCNVLFHKLFPKFCKLWFKIKPI